MPWLVPAPIILMIGIAACAEILSKKINTKFIMSNKWIGVMGYPLKQSLSKQIQEENIKSHHLPWKFKVLEWEPQEFEKNIRELKKDSSCVGFSVTMPYKEKIISYLDDSEDFATKVSSVNCVKNIDGKWTGYNTDAPGFLECFKHWNPEPPKNVQIVMLGAGATARTLSYALAMQGFKHFTLINRTLERAKVWGEKLRSYFPDIKVDDNLEMTNVFILNTTPLGKKIDGDEAVSRNENLDIFEISKLKNPAWIFDVTYNPAETLLIRQCRSRCFYTMNGWPMFMEQANLAFKIWKKGTGA